MECCKHGRTSKCGACARENLEKYPGYVCDRINRCAKMKEAEKWNYHDETGRTALFNTFVYCPWCGKKRIYTQRQL